MSILIIFVVSLLFLSSIIWLAAHAQVQTSPAAGLSQLGESNASSAIRIVSLVENVTVSKLIILSPHRLSVDLRYSGSGSTPSVKIDSSAININSKLVEQLPEEIGKLTANSTELRTLHQTLVANNSTNKTTLINEKLNALGDVMSESNGTAIVDKGWKSPKSVVVKLSGDGTLANAISIGILVRK